MEWVDNIVLGLIEEYGTRDVYELCDALEIEIREVDSNNIILHDCEAYYVRYYDDKEIIFISIYLLDHYKDFILKHELGHAILHPHILNSLDKNLVNEYKLEKQANYFALALSNVTFDEIELNEMTLDQIASCIKVPQTALKQLVNL